MHVGTTQRAELQASAAIPRPALTWSLVPRATIDFELRSQISVVDVGAFRYARHPTTFPLVMSYRLPFWPEGEVRRWHPAFPQVGIEATAPPDDLFRWIRDGGLVEAHNAMFEYAIWTCLMTPRFGWPEVPLTQWRCSAAKAAAHALPRALEDCARVLGATAQKDVATAKIVKKMWSPRKLLKREQRLLDFELALKPGEMMPEADEHGLYWHMTRDLFEANAKYCDMDVLAEEGVSLALPDLSPAELDVFHFDMQMNAAGVYLDREAVEAALRIIDVATGDMAAEIPVLTDNEVQKPSQRAKLKAWVESRGVDMVDTTGDTVDGLLDKAVLPDDVRRVLEVCRSCGRSSTAKYQTMMEVVCDDDYARGLLMFNGASTGRWSGKLIQPHNFPKGTIEKLNMVAAWEDILAAAPPGQVPDIAWLSALYGDVMELLASALRGVLTAPPGYELAVADFASIEARVLAWLAGSTKLLDLFRANGDPYSALASKVYGFLVTKKTHPRERDLGKAGVLGLGFQMGAEKFVATCLDQYGIVISLEMAQLVVETYRNDNPEIAGYQNARGFREGGLWNDVHDAAMRAVQSHGQTIFCADRRISFRVVGRFLYCKLPSGRKLAYCDPRIEPVLTSWGKWKDQITYMAVSSLTRQWVRESTYPGKLVENLVQAIARDLLASAMLRAARTGRYGVRLTVHDEVFAYVLKMLGITRHEFEALMSEVDDWAIGCPVGAEAWVGPRYKK